MRNFRRVLGCLAVPALLLALTVWFVYSLVSDIGMINQIDQLKAMDPKNGGLLALPIISIVLLSLGVAAVVTFAVILMVKAHKKDNGRGCKLRLAAIGMIIFIAVLWIVDLLMLIALLEMRKAAGAINPTPAPTLISVLVLLGIVLAGYITGLAIKKELKLKVLGYAASLFVVVEFMMVVFNRVNNSADATVVDVMLLLALAVQAVYFLLPKEECCCCCEQKEEKKEQPHAKFDDIPVEEEPAEVLPEPEEEVEEHEAAVEVPVMEEKEEDMEVGPVQEGSPEAHAEERKKLETLKQAGLISEEEYNKKLEKLQ